MAAATSRTGGDPLGTLEGLVAAALEAAVVAMVRDGARANKTSSSSQDQTLQGQDQQRLGKLNGVGMSMVGRSE